jgi:hypothetical protein
LVLGTFEADFGKLIAERFVGLFESLPCGRIFFS